MEKKLLESFIKKYSLGGNIEKARVKCTDKGLSTNTISDEKNCLCLVSLKKFDAFGDTEFGVHDTSKLKKLLSVLSDTIEVSVNENSGKVTSLTLADDKIQVQYCTADLSVVQAAPSLKQLPEFNCEILIDEEFVNKFIKSRDALDSDTFTLLIKKDKLNLVIGYSSINSNRITLNVKTLNGLDKVENPINFSAKYLKEVLSANLECEQSKLRVSDKGLANISFETDIFKADYYIVASQTVE